MSQQDTVFRVGDMRTDNDGYYIVLDYLRVFAMFGVLAVHLSFQYPLMPVVREVCEQGGACVQVFFVISGYLGCMYFFKPGATVSVYYKRRALRILPVYYTAIVASMFFVHVVTHESVPPDIYGLGWLRYFLGLNTILPSNSILWSSYNGFWCMSDFFVFYAVIPFLSRWVNNFGKSIVFYAFCVVLAFVSIEWAELVATEYFPVTSGGVKYGPLGQMQYFALGMLTFMAKHEGKQSYALSGMLILLLFPSSLCDMYMKFALVSGVFILAVKGKDLMVDGVKLRILKFLSKYSFHVYLAHGLALFPSNRLAGKYFFNQPHVMLTVKFVLFVVFTVALCFLFEISQKVVNKMLLRKKYTC